MGVLRSGVCGPVVLVLAAGAAQAVTTSSASLSGTGFSVSTGFSDAYSSAAPSGGADSSVQSGGFFAAYGPNPIGAPQFATYPVRYSGMAFAEPYGGVLKAQIKAEQLSPGVPFRGGNAVAAIGGSMRLVGGDPGEPIQYVVTLPFDGLLQGSSTASLTLSWRPEGQTSWQSSRYDAFSTGSPFGTPINEDPQLSFQTTIGQRIEWTYRLEVGASTSAGGFGMADFSSTARMVFKLPTGITLDSEDGFLSAVPVVYPAVPEPQALALMLAGLAVLAPALRRRMRLS